LEISYTSPNIDIVNQTTVCSSQVDVTGKRVIHLSKK